MSTPGRTASATTALLRCDPLSDVPVGAVPFRASYRIRTGDIDCRRRVRLDAIARYLQDVAADMLEASPFYHSDPFWILRRTIIDVIRPISWPGRVEVERWCAATSTRWVNMRETVRSEHEISPFNPHPRAGGLVETESFCIKIDQTGQLSRISDHAQVELSTHVTDTRFRWHPYNSTQLPPESSSGRYFPIRSSDIDAFGHVNNAIYWQIVEDQLDDNADLLTRPHRGIVEFHRPIPPGSEPVIVAKRVEDLLSIWIVLAQDTVAATATVRPLHLIDPH